MTSITRNDINQDISLLTNSLSDNELPLVSPGSALKLSMVFPFSFISIYTMAICWRWYFFVPKEDAFGYSRTFIESMSSELGFAAFGVLCALIIGASLYGPSLLYLSIPSHVREKSLVINKMKSLIRKMAAIVMLANLIIAVIGATWFAEVIAAAPFAIMLSFFLMQWVVSAEITRYGIGPVMKKLSSLVKKI